MAVRIVDLAPADPLDGTEEIEVTQGAFSRRTSLEDVAALGPMRIVQDIATLRTTAGRYDGDAIYVAGYYSDTPGQGGGPFRWFASNTVPDDQGITIAVTGVPTGRWLRDHSRVEPAMFGEVPIAGVDRTAARHAMWDYLRAQLLPSGVAYTAGVYQYNDAPNMAIPDIQVKTEGEVRWRYTGSGNAVIIDAGSGSQTCFNVQIGDVIVECPGTAGHGVYVRSIHESNLGFNVPTAGATSAGIRVDFAVLTTFRRPTSSSNVVSFYGAAPPKYGVFLTRRNVGEMTSYCRFEGISAAGCEIGLHLDWTLGNIFLGGALQGCTSRGLETTANALRDKIIGVDFEANTTRDIVCLGRQIEFHQCDTTLSVFLAGSNNRLMGGNHETIEIDSSGVQNTLGGGLLYRRNNTGSLIDNGQQTCMRDLVLVDSGGSTFTRHNAKPNRTTPSLPATGPHSITNTTGNDLAFFVVGGTGVALTISRTGFPGTSVGANAGMVQLAPEDTLNFGNYTVAPTVTTLSQ